jgi:hypothetical protein
MELWKNRLNQKGRGPACQPHPPLKRVRRCLITALATRSHTAAPPSADRPACAAQVLVPCETSLRRPNRLASPPLPHNTASFFMLSLASPPLPPPLTPLHPYLLFLGLSFSWMPSPLSTSLCAAPPLPELCSPTVAASG